MATRAKSSGVARGKTRLRSEIVEISRELRRIGAIDDAELAKTTLRMLGRSSRFSTGRAAISGGDRTRQI